MRLHELSGSTEDAVREAVEKEPEYTNYDLIKMMGMAIGFDPSLRKANKVLQDNYGFNLLELFDAMVKNPGKVRQLGSNYNIEDLDMLFEAVLGGDPYHSPHQQQYGFLSPNYNTSLIDIIMQYNMNIHPEYANDPAKYMVLRNMLKNSLFNLQKDIKDGFGFHVNFDKKIPLPKRGGYGHRGHEGSPIAALGDMFMFFQQAIHFGVWAWNVISLIAKGHPMSEIADYMEQYERSCNDPNEPAPTGSPIDRMHPELKEAYLAQVAKVDELLNAGKQVDTEPTVQEPESTIPIPPVKPAPAAPIDVDDEDLPAPESSVSKPKAPKSDEVRLKEECDEIVELYKTGKLTRDRFNRFKRQYETYKTSLGEIPDIETWVRHIGNKPAFK